MPRLVSLTLAFALQLRKKHGKTSVRVEKPQSRYESVEDVEEEILYVICGVSPQ